MQGLENVDGNIGGDQKELQDALKDVQLDAAYGQIELDENRNGHRRQLRQADRCRHEQRQDPDVKTFRRIPAVDQTFGATSVAETPAPDREIPDV